MAQPTIVISPHEESQDCWARVGNTVFNLKGLRVLQRVDALELYLEWEDGHSMRVSGAEAGTFFEQFSPHEPEDEDVCSN